MPDIISTFETDTGGKEQTTFIETETENNIQESVSWEKVVS